MLLSVVANCKCGVCGTAFQVCLDPAVKPPKDGALYEIVEEAVRGAWTSAVRDGQWLCSACEIKDREGAGGEE